jgi:hypothetical protein
MAPGFGRCGTHEEDTPLKSTTPDGKSIISGYKSDNIRFNRRDRTQYRAPGQGHRMRGHD